MIISDSLIDKYISRLVNRHDLWFRQWVDFDGNCQYVCKRLPVTPNLVRKHFEGAVTCSWPAVDEHFNGKWLAFDSDTNDGGLDQLHAFLKKYGWQTIREGRRAGRSGHLWILLDEPVPADKLIILGDAMTRLAGVSGLERFPKSATSLSQLRAPLGINLKPGANRARAWFDGVEQNIPAQLEWLAAQRINRAADALREAERHKPALIEPVKHVYRGGTRTHTNILELVDARRIGREYVAQCPLCEREGHDRHRDNLHISNDGQKFCCWHGGQPGKIHTAKDIIKALLAGKAAQ